ncbi:MAG TPA: hypothetical protein VIL55_08730, partial [Naasia sp.]
PGARYAAQRPAAGQRAPADDWDSLSQGADPTAAGADGGPDGIVEAGPEERGTEETGTEETGTEETGREESGRRGSSR